jgi:hypothetical protein
MEEPPMGLANRGRFTPLGGTGYLFPIPTVDNEGQIGQRAERDDHD